LQLEGAKRFQREAEEALLQKKSEYSEMRDRLLNSEHHHFQV
jgi:hypothetical protein